jgi:hypothetical protein
MVGLQDQIVGNGASYMGNSVFNWCEEAKYNWISTLMTGDSMSMLFPYQPGNKLPMMLTSCHFSSYMTMVGLAFEDTIMLANLTMADRINQKLNASRNELLNCYWKLGHINMQHVKMMTQIPT